MIFSNPIEFIQVKTFIYSIFILLAISMLSCSQNASSKNEVESVESTNVSSETESVNSSLVSHPGEAVYISNCLACHQKDGSGVPGMYPPLWPNQWISEDKAKMIDIMLNGLKGEIEVGGEIYNNEMPPHNQMSDQDIADVLSYVRSSFNNKLGPITKNEVTEARMK
jgi:mono/diheme cytochrome c family protein